MGLKKCFLCTKKLVNRAHHETPEEVSEAAQLYSQTLVNLFNFENGLKVENQSIADLHHDDRRLLKLEYCSRCAQTVRKLNIIFKQLGRLRRQICQYKTQIVSQLIANCNDSPLAGGIVQDFQLRKWAENVQEIQPIYNSNVSVPRSSKNNLRRYEVAADCADQLTKTLHVRLTRLEETQIQPIPVQPEPDLEDLVNDYEDENPISIVPAEEIEDQTIDVDGDDDDDNYNPTELEMESDPDYDPLLPEIKKAKLKLISREDLKTIASNMELFCNICGAQFFREESLIFHVRTHTYKYPCMDCDKGYSKSRSLSSHRSRNHNAKRIRFTITKLEETQIQLIPVQPEEPDLKDLGNDNEDEDPISIVPADTAEVIEDQTIDVDRKDDDDDYHPTELDMKSDPEYDPMIPEIKKAKLELISGEDSNNQTIATNKELSCNICGAQFCREDSLKLHVRSHTYKHPCMDCDKGYTNRGSLSSHMSRKHVKRIRFTITRLEPIPVQPEPDLEDLVNDNVHKDPISIDSNNQTTATATNKELSCNICGAQFFREDSLKFHVRSHTHKHPCMNCDKGYTNRRSLSSHWSRMHNVKRVLLTCPSCPYKTLIKSRLKDHRLTHTGERNFICQHCGLSFISSQPLKYHVGSQHPDLNSTSSDLNKYKCDHCNKVCGTPASLRDHIGSQHLNRWKLHCEICGKGVNCHSALRRHMLAHTGERSYECNICHAKFKIKSALKNHESRHIGDYKHTCSVCSKKFIDGPTLRRHELIHSGVIKYFCPHCNKGFPVKNYLYIHLRSHESKEERTERKKKPKLNNQRPLQKLYDVQKFQKSS